MKLLHGAIAAVLFALSSPLWAAPKSVTLAVPGMTCPTCPVTIKKALMKEQGVASVTRPRQHNFFRQPRTRPCGSISQQP